MAVEQFVVGKCYRWVGPKGFNGNWNEHMEDWKDGKPRKCTFADSDSTMYASFEKIAGSWHYQHCKEHFIEAGGLKVSFVAAFGRVLRSLRAIQNIGSGAAAKREAKLARKRETKRRPPAVTVAPIKVSLPEEESTMVVDIARIRAQALKALDAPLDENLLQQLL